MGLVTSLRENLWPTVTAEDRAGYEAKTNLPAPGSAAYATWLAEVNSKAGVGVNVWTSLQVTAVLACVKVIAEGVAQVPFKLYRDDGKYVMADPSHSLYSLLYRSPNTKQTSFEFREQLAYHVLLTGNAFALIMKNARGDIEQLLPLEPRLVRYEQLADRSMRYWIRISEKSGEVEVPPSMVWHIRGPSWSGYEGLDIVKTARNAIGLAIATESFGSEMFANGVRLSGALETPGTLGPEQAKQILQAWEATHEGASNRLKTALLTGGVTFRPHEIKADEAQYIETRRFLIEEVCRVFRVNPVMVMHQMNNMAYASVEQLLIAHVTHTLGPWFRRFEQSAEVALLTKAELDRGYQIQLVEQVLMRGTAKDRVDVAAVMRQNGAMTGNQMREAMDLPRDNDPTLDEYTPAAHLYGQRQETAQ